MPIDYSKWDKIELSDDSDIEVHPNVDKRSFIRWKQRDIHEKRHQRNIEIKSILIQLTMYAKLNARLDFLMEKLKPSELLDEAKVKAALDGEFDPKEKFDYEKLKKEKGSELRKGLHDLEFSKDEIEATPPYNEMVEDLFTQVKEDHPEVTNDDDKLKQHLKEHRLKIDDILLKQSIKLDSLLHEKANLISSEDYHTGFDSSFINKDKKDAEEKNTKPQTTTSTSIETINNPRQPENTKSSGSQTDDEYDQLEVLPPTAEFAKIDIHKLAKSREFLLLHPEICTEHQKDSLIMTAFDHQLEGREKMTKQVVHQSLLLQYVSQLSGGGLIKDRVMQAIEIFFSKLMDSSTPVAAAFNEDVDKTLKHIQTRCKVIQEERSALGETENEEAVIQLRSLDESKQLTVNVPDEGTEEYKIFSLKLSPEMQAAIQTGDLDEVNKIFASMKVEDAEEVLEIINECNVIGLSGYLENEEEFEKMKAQQDDAPLVADEQLNVDDTVD